MGFWRAPGLGVSSEGCQYLGVAWRAPVLGCCVENVMVLSDSGIARRMLGLWRRLEGARTWALPRGYQNSGIAGRVPGLGGCVKDARNRALPGGCQDLGIA